jgi:copper homeostasis protein CutC
LAEGPTSTGESEKAIITAWATNLELNMANHIAFDDALEAAEQLDIDAQAELVEVLSRRLAERGRERVAATIAQARLEFAAGHCEAMTAAEIIREAQP